MKIIKFNKNADFKMKDITNEVEELPDGMWECVIRKPKRTPKQNNTIHALFADLAVELEGLGIEYKMGNFIASWTEDSAKEFFKQIYLNGKKTSQVKSDIMAKATDKLLHDINRLGGQLSIKH